MIKPPLLDKDPRGPAHMMAELPVAQAKPSHDLAIDAKALIAPEAVVVIPAYVTMSEGDQLTLTWRGFNDGQLDSTWTRTVVVQQAQVGQPMVWGVPRIEVTSIKGGYAEIDCQVVLAGSGSMLASPTQIIKIVPPVAPRLTVLTSVEHDPDTPLDPERFPEGLVMRLNAYEGMQIDDQVVLYADGAVSGSRLVRALRIDQSHIQGAQVEFLLEPEWLHANQGGQVTLFYQFARPGVAMSSEPLSLEIHAAVPLPAPTVEKASAEGDPGQRKGFLQAAHVTTGVFIKVPESVTLAAGDRLEMHWHGHPAGGQFIATEPVDGVDIRRFFIPPHAVPANMGEGEDKRFDVFFRLLFQSGQTRDSPPFGLRILPLDTAGYPVIQWGRLEGQSTLSLKSVPAGGEALRLDSWTFMAPGQRVTLEATGMTATGVPTRVIVRDALPVTAQEAALKQISGTVPRSFLSGLRLNEYITLSASVSFDGGQSRTHFISNHGVRLVA